MNEHVRPEIETKLFPVLKNLEQLEKELSENKAEIERQKANTTSLFQREYVDLRKTLPQMMEFLKTIATNKMVKSIGMAYDGYATYNGVKLQPEFRQMWAVDKPAMLENCKVLAKQSQSLNGDRERERIAAYVVKLFNTYWQYNNDAWFKQHQNELLSQRVRQDCASLLQKQQMITAQINRINEQYPRLVEKLKAIDSSLRSGVEVETTEELSEQLQLPIGAEMVTYMGNMYYASLKMWDLMLPLHIHDQTPQGRGYDNAGLNRFLKDLALRFLHAYPHSAICYDLIDGDISRLGGALPPHSVHRIHSFSAAPGMSTLMSTIEERSEVLGLSYQNILEYNLDNPSAPQKLLLVFVDEKYLRNLNLSADVIQKAYQCGIYFVFVSRPKIHDYDKSVLEYIQSERFTYQADAGEDILSHDGGRLNLRLRTDGTRSDRELCEVLRRNTVEHDLNYTKVLNGFTPEKPAWEQVTIPFGESNGRLQTLTFDNKSAHCAILGPNGSGKSNLLHALILGATKHYSPDELQIIIIDGQKNIGEKYLKGKLPHLSCSLTFKNTLDMHTFWSYLMSEKNRRQSLFDAEGCDDIVSYNKKFKDRSPIPRLLVFIDEFASIADNLFSKNENLQQDFWDLVRAARSAGISLIISMPSRPSLFRTPDLLAQFSNKFEVKPGNMQGSLIEKVKNSRVELPEGMGYCFFEHDGQRDIDIVKIARVENEDEHTSVETYVEENRMRHGKFHMQLVTDRNRQTFDATAWTERSLRAYKDNELMIPLGMSHFFGDPQHLTFKQDMPAYSVWGKRRRCLPLVRNAISACLSMQSCMKSDIPLVMYGDFAANSNETEWQQYLEDHDVISAQNPKDLQEMQSFLLDCITARRASSNRSPVLVILMGFNNVTKQSGEAYLDYTKWRNIMQNGYNNNIFFMLQFDQMPQGQATDTEDALYRNVLLVPDSMDIAADQRNALISSLASRIKKIPSDVIQQLPAHLIARFSNQQVAYVKPYEI